MASVNLTITPVINIDENALREEIAKQLGGGSQASDDLLLDTGRRRFECRGDAMGVDHLKVDVLRPDGRIRVMAHSKSEFISAHLSPADARELAAALIALAAQAEA